MWVITETEMRASSEVSNCLVLVTSSVIAKLTLLGVEPFLPLNQLFRMDSTTLYVESELDFSTVGSMRRRIKGTEGVSNLPRLRLLDYSATRDHPPFRNNYTLTARFHIL